MRPVCDFSHTRSISMVVAAAADAEIKRTKAAADIEIAQWKAPGWWNPVGGTQRCAILPVMRAQKIDHRQFMSPPASRRG